jgi:hypothetical protein
MGLRFIREPSETPNVTNADDARMIRYAYGGNDGCVKGKGSELSYTVNGTTFTLNSGIVSLQGYEVEVDSNGLTITIDNVSTKRYFSVWYEVNLALQTATIKSAYSTSGYPTVPVGDDLNAVSTGTARLLLYRFTATNGVMADVVKHVTVIKYAKELVTDLQTKITDGTITAKKATDATNCLFAYKDFDGNIIKAGDYRRKSERVLFYTNTTTGFVVSDTDAHPLNRNTGNAELTENSFIEIELQKSTGAVVRQTIKLNGEATTARCFRVDSNFILETASLGIYYNHPQGVVIHASEFTMQASTADGSSVSNRHPGQAVALLSNFYIYRIWVINEV